MAWIGRDEQVTSLTSVEFEPDGLPVGQDNPLDARTEEAVQLVAQASEGQMVDVHGSQSKQKTSLRTATTL
jgi:hypothetical protein